MTQKNKKNLNREPSSFRDPSGFVYYQENKVLRQINSSYVGTYQKVRDAGIYDLLEKKGWLIPHKKVANSLAFDSHAAFVIEAENIPFISYPYEWCFSQLKEAALLTLNIQKEILQHGFCLKDASAYNIQFLKGKPIFIDLLSFEPYTPGKPWVAYRQFCQHFLGPILVMAKTNIHPNTMLRLFLDGLPLPLISTLLPNKTYLNLSTFMHIHAHAKSQQYFSGKKANKANKARISQKQLMGIIDNLESFIKKQEYSSNTEWSDYYSFTNYSSKAFDNKKSIISKFINQTQPKSVWDLGGNTGEFSRISSDKKIPTISFDIDPKAIELSYHQVEKNREQHILPLVLDLTNPSPNLGWDLQERTAITKRGKPDLVMALALIHHLHISNNLPFHRIASFLKKLCTHLIIEFIPKEDSQVQKLLSTRNDIFPNYDQPNFENVFSEYFTLIEKKSIKHDSLRTLYLYQKNT